MTLLDLSNIGKLVVMENNETYYIAKLSKEGKFLSSDIFETLESARLWAMKETKLLVSDSFLRKCKADDVIVEIDKHFFGYEISSEEIIKNSEKVAA